MDPEEAERWARRFHELYEELAPGFGYATREESRKPWEEVPQKNRELMIAVARGVVGEATAALEQERDRLAKELERAHGIEEEAQEYQRERDQARAEVERLKTENDEVKKEIVAASDDGIRIGRQALVVADKNRHLGLMLEGEKRRAEAAEAELKTTITAVEFYTKKAGEAEARAQEAEKLLAGWGAQLRNSVPEAILVLTLKRARIHLAKQKKEVGG